MPRAAQRRKYVMRDRKGRPLKLVKGKMEPIIKIRKKYGKAKHKK